MDRRIAFIGAGSMGGALLERVCGHMEDPRAAVMTRRDADKGAQQARRLGCTWAPDASRAVRGADYILLCVKPRDIFGVLDGVLPDLQGERAAGRRPVVVSIAAGVPLSQLEERITAAGLDVPAARLMPNTPAAVGEGVLFLTGGKGFTREDREGLTQLLAPCGLIEPVSEEQLEMGGALAGCGPAFVYLFIEALADGAVEIGLPRAEAQRWAARTVLGAAQMVLKTGRHPGALKDAVCSPGGSTIAGVAALEGRAFRAAAAEAVKAAYRRFNP